MAATEKFYNGVSSDNVSVDAPATDAFAITPDDASELTYITRAIFVGLDGDIKVKMKDGTAVTFQNCVAGSVLPIRASQVYATGTTATGLIGLI